MSGLIASKFFDEALTKIRPLLGPRGKILIADDPDFVPAGGTDGGGGDQDPAWLCCNFGGQRLVT